jgi:hypothetical protein
VAEVAEEEVEEEEEEAEEEDTQEDSEDSEARERQRQRQLRQQAAIAALKKDRAKRRRLELDLDRPDRHGARDKDVKLEDVKREREIKLEPEPQLERRAHLVDLTIESDEDDETETEQGQNERIKSEPLELEMQMQMPLEIDLTGDDDDDDQRQRMGFFQRVGDVLRCALRDLDATERRDLNTWQQGVAGAVPAMTGLDWAFSDDLSGSGSGSGVDHYIDMPGLFLLFAIATANVFPGGPRAHSNGVFARLRNFWISAAPGAYNQLFTLGLVVNRADARTRADVSDEREREFSELAHELIRMHLLLQEAAVQVLWADDMPRRCILQAFGTQLQSNPKVDLASYWSIADRILSVLFATFDVPTLEDQVAVVAAGASTGKTERAMTAAEKQTFFSSWRATTRFELATQYRRIHQ